MKKLRIVNYLFFSILLLSSFVSCDEKIPFKPMESPTQWALDKLSRPLLSGFSFSEESGVAQGYLVTQEGSVDASQKSWHLQKAIPIVLEFNLLNGRKVPLQVGSPCCSMVLSDGKTGQVLSSDYNDFLLTSPELEGIENISGQRSGTVTLKFTLSSDLGKVPEHCFLSVSLFLQNEAGLIVTERMAALSFFVNAKPLVPLRHDGQQALSAIAPNWSAVVEGTEIAFYWEVDPTENIEDLAEFLVSFSTNKGQSFETETIPVDPNRTTPYRFARPFSGAKEDLLFKIAVKDRYGVLSREISTSDKVSVFKGEGTPTNPFEITTIEQLDFVRSLPDAHYRQLNDLVFSPSSSMPTWVPIPDFKGSYDGGRFSIQNMVVDGANGEKLGIFANTLEGSLLKQIKVEAITLKNGSAMVGGLVGEALGDLENCHVKNATFENCVEQVGGLVGLFKGSRIERCSNRGEAVVAIDKKVGGLVGELAVGEESISIIKSFNQAEIQGDNFVAGLVGSCQQLGSGKLIVQSCYNVGKIDSATGQNGAGLIAGERKIPIDIQNSYSTQGLDKDYYFVSSELTATGATNVTYFQSYSPASTSPFNGTKKMLNWFSSPAFVPELGADYEIGDGIKNPSLKENPQKSAVPIDLFFRGELGTEGDPIKIKDKADFEAINLFLALHQETTDFFYYQQANDIDFNNQEITAPLISADFKGVYNGNEKQLSSLKAKTMTPFFKNVVGDDSVIKDLVLDAITVKNDNMNSAVGALAGRMEGKIENCHLNGNCAVATNKDKPAGGLVGSLVGSMSKCSNRGATVTGTSTTSNCLGGLIGSFSSGFNSCLLKNCYNAGTIKASASAGAVGGLAGEIIPLSVIIENCYNIGKLDIPTSSAIAGAGFFSLSSSFSGHATIRHSYSLAGGKSTTHFFTDSGSSTKIRVDSANCFSPGSNPATDGTQKMINFFQSVDYFPELAGIFEKKSGISNLVLKDNPQTKEFPIDYFFRGELGSQADPFKIGTTKDFKAIHDFVKNNTGFFYYQQTANIDFGAASSSSSKIQRSFRGVYDGKNYELSSFTISDIGNTPFFESVKGSDSILKNIKLKRVRLNRSSLSPLEADDSFGLLASEVEGTVENCHIDKSCSIKLEGSGEDSPVGGLVGLLKGSMKLCSNQGAKIECGGTFNPGGLIGKWETVAGGNLLEKSYNQATIKSEDSVIGGLVGIVLAQEGVAEVKSCYNLGSLIGVLGTNCGGFFTIDDQSNEPITITNSYSLNGGNGEANGYFVDSDSSSKVTLSSSCFSLGNDPPRDGVWKAEDDFKKRPPNIIPILYDKLLNGDFTVGSGGVKNPILKENKQTEPYNF